MLYKESAIAVMVAVVLVFASLLGGFSIPALATHDPNAVALASEEIDQGSDETMTIDSIGFDAKKSNSRAAGTLTVEIIQDDKVIRSGSMGASAVKEAFSGVEVDLTNINVTGSFEILVEYVGTGLLTVRDIEVIEGTGAASGPDADPDDNESPDNPPDDQPQDQVDLENVIVTKSLSASDGTTIDTVDFSAKKSNSRATGTLTVAVVQDDEVLGSYDISSSNIKEAYSVMEVTFEELEVSGDFQVVFMYDGSGVLSVSNISVEGGTEAPEDDPDTTPNDGALTLTVQAVDQNNNKVGGMWVALLNGQNQVSDKGFTDVTFTLTAGNSYIVEMGSFYDDQTQTSYQFQKWQDSTTDSTRRTVDTTKFGDDGKETFTALYTVTQNASPPPDDGNDGQTTTPPPTSPAGTITLFAYRVPSEFWGPSFVSANAEMYFVLYNATGYIVETGFFNEMGTTVSGLNDGQTYWVYPTDCDECHNDPHDVNFDHWQDGSTDRPRAVMTGTSAGAYYVYDPDP